MVRRWWGLIGRSSRSCSVLRSRLLKKAHLLRWRARALTAAYLQYASLGPSLAALHLDLFEQPGRIRVVQHPARGVLRQGPGGRDMTKLWAAVSAVCWFCPGRGRRRARRHRVRSGRATARVVAASPGTCIGRAPRRSELHVQGLAELYSGLDTAEEVSPEERRALGDRILTRVAQASLLLRAEGPGPSQDRQAPRRRGASGGVDLRRPVEGFSCGPIAPSAGTAGRCDHCLLAGEPDRLPARGATGVVLRRGRLRAGCSSPAPKVARDPPAVRCGSPRIRSGKR